MNLKNKEISALELIKNKTKEILKEITEHHGWKHAVIVARYAKLLALNENENVFNAETAGWTHDWGRAIKKTNKKRKHHAKLSGIISKNFYKELLKNGRITTKQYSNIRKAIKQHSLKRKTKRNTLKIVRDADKLSRFGSLGLYHIVLHGIEKKLPFYIKNRPIVRQDKTEIIQRRDIKSIIDDINFCLDWRKLMETKTGKKTVERLEVINKTFLKLFSRHSDLIDTKLWQSFLKINADKFKRKLKKFDKNFQWTNTKNDFEKWLKFYKEVESPDIFSEANFQKFLYDNKSKK